MNRTLLPGALVALLVAIAAGGGYLLHGVYPTRGERGAASSKAGAPGATPAESLQAAFVGVSEHLRPAVVNVGIIQKARPRRAPGPQPGSDDPFFQDFFKQFFGSESPSGGPEFRRPGLGSGVIFDKRGLILTNFHVIKGADEITVKMADKREYTGQVVGTDPKTDLAVVRFQPDRELTVATLGNSDSLRVGEWAIAIGNPFGLDQTVTVGVISATGRSDVGVATYENFIQTDASINPGNSGGPLINLKGEVIGINTAIFSQSGGSIGIGFAIPINMVKRVVDQLVDKGKVVRGWVGVSLQPLSPELAESLGVPDKQGAVVGSTMAGSPAAAAGLLQNDVILAYDKTPVESSQHFQRLTAETRVGSKVVLQVLRKKQKVDVTITVAEAPDESPRRPTPTTPQPKG
jgi:Do/DeqQ family serine protease